MIKLANVVQVSLKIYCKKTEHASSTHLHLEGEKNHRSFALVHIQFNFTNPPNPHVSVPQKENRKYLTLDYSMIKRVLNT